MQKFSMSQQPIPQLNLTPEQAINALLRPEPIGGRHKAPTSRKCRCGQTISSNAIACRKCMLDGVDKAITQLEGELGKRVGAGEFAKGNEISKALTKLQGLRSDVFKGYRKEMNADSDNRRRGNDAGPSGPVNPVGGEAPIQAG